MIPQGVSIIERTLISLDIFFFKNASLHLNDSQSETKKFKCNTTNVEQA